jgi:hypothetical protein
MPTGAVPLMMVMYGGALFTLVTAPPGSVTAESVWPLAEHIVFGALHTADATAAGAARSTWTR